MALFHDSAIAGASGNQGGGGLGYQISRSLRFNSSDSAYLSRTPASAGNRKTWTWAGWVKRSSLDTGTNQVLFSGGVGTADTTFTQIDLAGTNTLRVTGYTTDFVISSAVFRDVSAWYHITVAFDATQGTNANKLKVYINGSEIAYGTDNRASISNQDYGINQAAGHAVGRNSQNSARYFNGYLADIHFIDGQALTPSSFTEVSATTGQLIPKQYTGSFGTNGFWLKFSDNSAATATTLGKDYSGNNNNWSPTNLSVTAGAGNDSLVDTPTSYGTDTGAGGEVRGNYATWGATYAGAAGLTNGNLDFLAPTTMSAFGSISVTSGKWYWEILNSGTGLSYVGIMDSTITNATDTSWSTQSRAYVSGGSKYNGSSSSYGSSWAAGDVIGFALDLNSDSLTFYKNGVSQGVAFSTGLIGKEWKPFVYGSSGSGCSANFGQRQWAYAAPAGFKALCDTNLPAPVVAKSSDYFQTVLYTGNGSTQTISGLGFSPDLVWYKYRAGAAGGSHLWFDRIRTAGQALISNSTAAEQTISNALTAFNSDGFSLGDHSSSNYLNDQYVAWCWDAGSSTVTNTQGSITSQVRANPNAGFSIVTASVASSASGPTIGHGLGVTPGLIIAKNRTSAIPWYVWHSSFLANQKLLLNSTSAVATDTNTWGSITSSTLQMGATGTAVNVAWVSSGTENFVFYCFAPVAGYSSFGSYTGNGSADGPFVFCGFRPRWIMWKCTTAAYDWDVYDAVRDPYNAAAARLKPNSSDAEATLSPRTFDILSNGFKLREGYNSSNASSQTYIYAAFAESPFQYARAR